MSILLFAFAVAPCCYCADSFVDTPPLVVVESECSGFVVSGGCHAHGYMWGHDLASGQGTWKVQRCHCQSSVMPAGELTLDTLFALVLHVL